MRLRIYQLLAVVSLLATVVGAVINFGAYTRPGTPAGPHWEAWMALSDTERRSLAETYTQLQSRGAMSAALARGREFAALPPHERAHLRDLHAAASELIASMPPAQRRELLLLPPTARAWHLHRELRRQRAEPVSPPRDE